MSSKQDETNLANARYAAAVAVEAAIDRGVPGAAIADAFFQTACQLMAAVVGGEDKVPAALRKAADLIERQQSAPNVVN